MLASALPPSFLDTYRLCHLSDVRPYSSSLSFLATGPFVEVLPLSILRITLSYKRDSPDIYPFDEIPATELVFETFLVCLRYFF